MTLQPSAFHTADRLGLQAHRGRIACVMCRHVSKRPPCYTSGKRWTCVQCNAFGDSIDLVKEHLGLRYREAVNWINGQEVHEKQTMWPLERPREHMPHQEVASFLQGCAPLGDTLAYRGIGPTAPAAILPDRGRTWWRREWSKRYPVVIPLRDKDGKLGGFRARAIGKVNGPKSRCPMTLNKFSFSGLLFMNPTARKGDAEKVIFCEGEMDYLWWAERMPTAAVYGYISGSMKAIREMAWDTRREYYAAPHPDRAGESFMGRLAEALYPNVISVVPLGRPVEVV